MVIISVKTLQRMQCCTFQTYHRNAGIFNKLIDVQFTVIIFPVFQGRKSADGKNIKIFPKIGAASFTCSTVLPLMMASSSNSSAQPS